MLGRGSPEAPVKADSPARGWSGAESLDRAEASPTLSNVMAGRVAKHDRVQPVADRVVVESNEIGEQLAERTHGDTSNEMSQALTRGGCERPCGRPRYVGIEWSMRDCARMVTTRVSGPW